MSKKALIQNQNSSDTEEDDCASITMETTDDQNQEKEKQPKQLRVCRFIKSNWVQIAILLIILAVVVLLGLQIGQLIFTEQQQIQLQVLKEELEVLRLENSELRET